MYDADHAFEYSASGSVVTIPDGADRAEDVFLLSAAESYAVVTVDAPPSADGSYAVGSPGEACIDIGAGDGCANRPDAAQENAPEQDAECALNGLTCVERPAGADIVTVTSTSSAIEVGDGGDSATHDGSQDIGSAVDVQFREPDPELTEQFDDEDGTIVVKIPTKYDADGNRNHEAETNTARVEQALHELGKPYTVCFPEETITFYDEQTGEALRTVTYPEECILVTPS